MNQDKNVDRRERERFKVKPGSVVLVDKDWPHSTIVGNILDISKDGVAVQIVDDDALPESRCELKLACNNPPCFVEKLPAKAVSDVTMAKVSFGSLVPRRLGLRFGPLTDDQTAEIENYIKDNAIAKL